MLSESTFPSRKHNRAIGFHCLFMVRHHARHYSKIHLRSLLKNEIRRVPEFLNQWFSAVIKVCPVLFYYLWKVPAPTHLQEYWYLEIWTSNTCWWQNEIPDSIFVGDDAQRSVCVRPGFTETTWNAVTFELTPGSEFVPDSKPAENLWLKTPFFFLNFFLRIAGNVAVNESSNGIAVTQTGAIKRCWTGRRRASPRGSSRPTTSPRRPRTGRRSSASCRRPAEGTGRWTRPSSCMWRSRRSGPPRSPRSSCRWRPARPARPGRRFGGRSPGAGRSRRWTRACRGPRPCCCSLRWRRGSASSQGQPSSTCRGSFRPSNRLRGEMNEGQWVRQTCRLSFVPCWEEKKKRSRCLPLRTYNIIIIMIMWFKRVFWSWMLLNLFFCSEDFWICRNSWMSFREQNKGSDEAGHIKQRLHMHPICLHV